MHNLEQIDGETAFVAYRKAGWHGLGQVVEEELTAESAIKKAMLDWEVELHPIYSSVMSNDGVEVVPVEDKFAVIRKHPMLGERDALGVVGTRYTPIQNKEVFNFLDALVDSGSSYETAGSIDGGKKIFITMRMPNGILVDGKDKSDMYIFATTSHDGSFSMNVSLTAVRVVCQNTWRMARRASQYKHTIRHTANSNKSIAQARDVMKLSFEYGGFLQEQADKFLEKDLKEAADGVRRMFKDWEKKDIVVPITQGMFDVLVSIAFNAGVGGLRGSKIIKHLKKGDYSSAGDSIKKFGVSKKFRGLSIRRDDESKMFLASI